VLEMALNKNKSIFVRTHRPWINLVRKFVSKILQPGVVLTSYSILNAQTATGVFVRKVA
jgi:hypothetical protein